jgi:hypothetical protein
VEKSKVIHPIVAETYQAYGFFTQLIHNLSTSKVEITLFTPFKEVFEKIGGRCSA